jgi:uncharacterized protein YycO
MRGRQEASDSFAGLRRRATSGLAIATGLTIAVTIAPAPSYAAPSETPGTDTATAAALATAKKTGQRVKITEATTETSEYFATPEGKITGVITAGTTRFRRSGSWVPVDLTLRRQADGSVAPAAHPHDLRISGARDAASADLASLGNAAEKVTMGWRGALPEPRLDGSKATYAEVRPGIDLVVQATTSGFEQFTLVKSAAAAKYVQEISLPLTGPGVASVSEDSVGRMVVLGTDGREQAKIPTPMMWDSQSSTTGGKQKPPKRRQVAVDVIPTTATSTGRSAAGAAPVELKLKPSQAWLTSPDTVYPVTIDPVIDWSTTATSTTVVKDYPTGWPDADSLFVGSYDATWSSRSFVTWWANALQGKRIDSAEAHFANPFSTSCVATPFEIWSTGSIASNTSWANQPAWQYNEATAAEANAEYDAAHNISYCDDSWVTADVTTFFQRAASNNVATPTMGLRAVDETDYSQYKQFWSHNYSDPSKFPYVEVTYSERPQFDPNAFNSLLAMSPDVTAAELQSSLQTAATISGLSYNEAVMKAWEEAQLPEAQLGTNSTVQSQGTFSTFGVDTTCTKVQVGTAKFKGDIFFAKSTTAGVSHGHIGIYSDKSWIIEARGSGVLSGEFYAPGRAYCRNIQKMEVLTNLATQEKAANYAGANLKGKAYDSNFMVNKDSSLAKLNCSELVWKAYKNGAKIDLDGNGGVGVWPFDIRDSKKTRTYQTIS